MRRTIFSFLAIFVINTSFGQLQKGTWLVGGKGMYTASKNKSGDEVYSINRELTVQPNVGYFVVSKLATGLTLNGQFIKSKYPRPDGTTSISKQQRTGVGPFVRYYFLDAENTINLFSNASAVYTVNTNNSTSVKSKELDYTIGGGAAVFFNSAVALELLMEYKRSNSLNADTDWSATALQFREYNRAIGQHSTMKKN